MFLYLIFPPEYKWLESYLANDNFWLEDSLSWEESFILLLSDLPIGTFVAMPFFTSTVFHIDSLVKLSFLDIMFIIDKKQNNFSREIYDPFLWDLTATMSNKYIGLQFLFYTDNQDFMLTLLYYSPELLLAVTDFLNTYWFYTEYNQSPITIFDFICVNSNATLAEFADYWFRYVLLAWLVVSSIGIFRFLKLNNPIRTYLGQLINYLCIAAHPVEVQVFAHSTLPTRGVLSGKGNKHKRFRRQGLTSANSRGFGTIPPKKSGGYALFFRWSMLFVLAGAAFAFLGVVFICDYYGIWSTKVDAQVPAVPVAPPSEVASTGTPGSKPVGDPGFNFVEEFCHMYHNEGRPSPKKIPVDPTPKMPRPAKKPLWKLL